MRCENQLVATFSRSILFGPLVSTTSALVHSCEVCLITLSKHGIVLNVDYFPSALSDYLNLLPAEVRSSEIIQ